MRNYETVFIMDPALGDEKAAAEIDRAKSIIQSAKGEVLDVQKWGKRKLAYEIKKRREGIYALIRFRGDGAVVSDLERGFRLSELIIRFMTVVDDSLQRSEEGAEKPSGGAAAGREAPAASGEAAPASGKEAAAGSREAEAHGADSAAGRPQSAGESVGGEQTAAAGEESAAAETSVEGALRGSDEKPDVAAWTDQTPHAGDDAPPPGDSPSTGGAGESEEKGPSAVD